MKSTSKWVLDKWMRDGSWMFRAVFSGRCNERTCNSVERNMKLC